MEYSVYHCIFEFLVKFEGNIYNNLCCLKCIIFTLFINVFEECNTCIALRKTTKKDKEMRFLLFECTRTMPH